MTLTEAYIIFFGKVDDKIDVEYIQEKLTEEIIKSSYRKLTKEYHPDLHIDNKEYYTEECKKINVAYEILKQALTVKISKSSKRENDIKKPFTSKNFSLEFIDFYRSIIIQIFKIKEYKIITDFKKNIEYFYNEIVNSSNLEEIYDLRAEIIYIYEQVNKEFSILKEKKSKIFTALKSGGLTEELLEEMYKDFALENYSDWNDPLVTNYVNLWYMQDRELDYKIITDKFSYINNIKNKIKKILTDSKDLNASICYAMLSLLSKDTKKRLSKSISQEVKIKLYKTFFLEEKNYLDRITNWDTEVDRMIISLDKVDLSSIERKFISDIQKKIESALTSDYLILLDDSEKIIKLNKETKKRKMLYKKEKFTIDNSFKIFKLELFTYVRQYRKIIHDVEDLYKKHCKKEIQIENKEQYAKIDDDRIFETYHYYKEMASVAKKIAIDLYQKIFILCYFSKNSSNIDIGEFIMLYKLYRDSDSGFDANEYYDILVNEYQKNIFKENIILTSQTVKKARENMCIQIDNFLQYCEQINYQISDNLLDDYSKKDELDIISLSILYDDIINGINKNKRVL